MVVIVNLVVSVLAYVAVLVLAFLVGKMTASVNRTVGLSVFCGACLLALLGISFGASHEVLLATLGNGFVAALLSIPVIPFAIGMALEFWSDNMTAAISRGQAEERARHSEAAARKAYQAHKEIIRAQTQQ